MLSVMPSQLHRKRSEDKSGGDRDESSLYHERPESSTKSQHISERSFLKPAFERLPAYEAFNFENEKQATVDDEVDEDDTGGQRGDHGHTSGTMSVWDASVFITAELAGAGLLALSEAVSKIGVFGVPFIIASAGMAAYTGNLLGRTWITLETRDTALSNSPVRQPYAEMGRRTYGHWLGSVIVTLMNMTLFGLAVVLLLVCAELMEGLVSGSVDLCVWLLLLTALVTPFTWLGSPKHLQVPSLLALGSILMAAVLILILMLASPSRHHTTVSLMPTSFRNLCLGISTIMFSFTGVSTLPTIQLDMKDRTKLSQATAYGFFGLCLLYVPVATTGYMVFGDEAKTNITQNLPSGIMLTMTQVLLVMHYMGALIMLMNPVCQNLEEAWNIPFSEKMNRKRVMLRSGLMLVALMTAETIPSFGKIMNLIGGTFTLLLTFILPSLIYIRMRGEYCGKSKHGFKRYVTKRIFLLFVVLISLLVSITVIYFSLYEIVSPGGLHFPCYLQLLYKPHNNASVAFTGTVDPQTQQSTVPTW